MELSFATKHKRVLTDILDCADYKPGILYIFFCIVHTLYHPSYTNGDCESNLQKDRREGFH